jgi:recombination protein RecR
LSEAIRLLRTEVQYCQSCFNVSDQPTCSLCANPKRDCQLVCVVEDVRDVIAIESTAQFTGLYHVLGGKISPLDGIGPQELRIDSLVKKVKEGTINEVILALSSTVEGDTTNYFIYKQISSYDVQITVLARGVSVGDELEYTDEVSLGRSIVKRIPFDGTI